MASTQTALALQMIAQLRLLDPSASAEVGTPERKIIDTVAQAIYDSQIDLDALSQGLDVDGKYGAALTRLLALFGFTRQAATAATGFVTFSRLTGSQTDVRVPASTGIMASNVNGTNVKFLTTYDVILPAGSLSIVAPIRCTITGEVGNVPAGRISQAAGSTIFGITGIENEFPTANGADSESDEEFKVRFKNTLFRNLAGTRDQYLALAVATESTTRVNVIGPQSHYQEYIQVPFVDDVSSYDVNNDTIPETSTGNPGEYTTALSSIPFAKAFWTQNPVFVSSGNNGAATTFYRQGSDFRFNTSSSARNHGDTLRELEGGIGLDPATNNYPNVTFTNVYTGSDPSVTAVVPGDVVLLEYSYLSEASRNDPSINITNAVDVYIDGGNEQPAATVLPRPSTVTSFVDNVTSKYHYENYRRVGDPAKRPIVGNVLMELFWQPITDIPEQIVVRDNTYFANTHYWPIYDVSDIGGTIRARGGIEWSTGVFGYKDGDILDQTLNYSGQIITDTTGDPTEGEVIEIDRYTYDKNIVDLQAIYEGAKQVTTDVLVHKAKTRYFKLDITAMYSGGASVNDTNSQVRAALDTYLTSLYYGSAIQLSDLLQVVHSVSSIDNVRWTTDTPNSPDLARIYETNADGSPLAGVTTERVQPGNSSRPEIQELYITGGPTSGTFTLTYSPNTTVALPFNTDATSIQAAIAPYQTVSVIEVTRSTFDPRSPVRSFRITWGSNGARLQLLPDSNFLGGPYIINNDFFLRDNEIGQLATGTHTPITGAADTVPGLIIRSRAQNTFLVR